MNFSLLILKVIAVGVSMFANLSIMSNSNGIDINPYSKQGIGIYILNFQ